MMKLILLISLVSAVFSMQVPPPITHAWLSTLSYHFEECTEESKVDPDLAKNAFSGLALPDQEQLNCFYKCVHRKFNFYNADGEYDKATMVSAIDHLTDKMADKCIANAKSETDSCRKAYKISSCIIFENEV
ncbi:hypothetical protein FQA39_LY14611 [Lamprigera yunnana]|nr:hypothetical protein FQA39_LY14611 [Lamprigera yunnana]